MPRYTNVPPPGQRPDPANVEEAMEGLPESAKPAFRKLIADWQAKVVGHYRCTHIHHLDGHITFKFEEAEEDSKIDLWELPEDEAPAPTS